MTVKRLSCISYPLFFLLFLAGTAFSQETLTITLEDAFRSRKFSPAGLYGLRSMNDGLHYTVR